MYAISIPSRAFFLPPGPVQVVAIVWLCCVSYARTLSVLGTTAVVLYTVDTVKNVDIYRRYRKNVDIYGRYRRGVEFAQRCARLFSARFLLTTVHHKGATQHPTPYFRKVRSLSRTDLAENASFVRY